jgi:hypothetical protein
MKYIHHIHSMSTLNSAQIILSILFHTFETLTLHICTLNYFDVLCTGLFISPSGISDPCGTVAGMVTPKGSMSTERERHSKFLSYLTGDATDVKFWQIPRHRPLTYSLSTPCFVTTAPLAVKPARTPRRLVKKKKKTWRDSLSIYMLLFSVFVLVVAQSSSEIPEGLLNNPVLYPSKNVQI